MADILIKGMEMPKYTTKAEFGIDADGNPLCMVYHEKGTEPDIYDVVPLPEGHGRLIDADAFKEFCLASTKEAKPDFIRHEDWIRACAVTLSFCRDIDDAPTIVPAEGGTEECSEN